MMATKNQMEQLFSTLGIKYGDYLILYDAKGQVDAARLWWILHYYGYKKMSLLDGGIYDWERNSGAVRISKKREIH
jgi:thiosulfate/3-mercaptopyruvate sulfurtransferase